MKIAYQSAADYITTVVAKKTR